MSEEKQSYGSILKSSSLIGGAQAINMLLGMLRVKCVAVFLGPSGLGLLGMLQSLQAMVTTISGLGLNNSGVRSVAEANACDNQVNVARVTISLRRLCWLTGLLGALVLAVSSRALSELSFQTSDYTLQVAALGIAVLLASVGVGQLVLLQGLRKIAALAKVNVISSVFGTVVAVLCYVFFGMNGVVPALISITFFHTACAFWFSRKIELPKTSVTWRESLSDGRELIGLGLSFMWAALMFAAAEYLIRMMIGYSVGLLAVGIFTAAFRLSGIFLNFILSAMGADFYPSLTAAADDHQRMRDLVNQQTEIGLLLAVPGLLATLALAPWVIEVFYSNEFTQSVDLLRWFVLGCLGRVIAWPLGYIMLAKGAGMVFALVETLCHVLHVGLVYLGMRYFGLEGAGGAFFVLYVIYSAVVLCVGRSLIGFSWSCSVKRLLIVFLPISICTLLVGKYMAVLPATLIGIFVTIAVGIYCLRGLCERLGEEHKCVQLLKKVPFSTKLLSL